MTASVPAAGDLTSPDYWEARWRQANNDAATETANQLDAHTASEWHSGRFRFVQYGVDVGVPGTPLTTDWIGIVGHRVIRWPLEIVTWAMTASPAAATITFDVKKAASLADFNAGVYTSIVAGGAPTLSGQRGAEGPVLGVWTVATFDPGEVLIFEVTDLTPGSAEVVSFQLDPRRT